LQALLKAVGKLCLQRVVAFVRAGCACVDSAPIGEQPRCNWRVCGRLSTGKGQGIFIRRPDELMCLRPDIRKPDCVRPAS
jgi:hypothetical protein